MNINFLTTSFLGHFLICQLTKDKNVVDLLDKSELFLRRIAGITGHSVNTVRKIRQLKEI